ncbi:non-ribosomal peptide synthetase [Paenibacillus ihuae]|uniref:non-ribosomal peptide synthetase n=1 Tax=Paenibacillus ihuae TaxID=1232431 RepID=UPI0006D5AA3A|nr:non-ribosomal peptide synthetase [Paenibacillus ihuae]
MNLSEIFNKTFNIYHSKRAILDDTRTLTYQQLDGLTRGIAAGLRRQGVGEGDVVAIECVSRIEAIALMIGTIRAGAAYCVIPEAYPDYRKEKMKALVQAKLSVHQVDWADGGDTGELPEAVRKPDSLLYIIFTSGSTGEPKAVAIEDHSIAKIVNEPSFYSGNVMGQLAPLEFDASVYEIFGGLLNGMTLKLIPKDDSLDCDNVPERFSGIDTLFLTTRLFNLYVDEAPELFRKVSLVLTGGERCSVHHLQEAARHCTVLHVYGPTETTVFATSHKVTGAEQDMPIGRIFDQGTFMVVGDNNLPVPQGQQGELLIADSGVMRGYLGDEEASRRVLLQQDRGRFYRTGDAVYLNDAGEIVYVERKDRQVKISGYRIELGEVEKCAYDFGLQKDCLAHYDGKRLTLYVKDQVDLEQLRGHLRSRLPEYMVPTVKVVDIIPMNTNGKTDIQEIISGNCEANESRNEIMKVMTSVLSSELTAEQTFLDVGGDSIKAMEIIWQLGSKGYQLDLDTLFSRTIGEIADNVSNG